MLGLVLGGTVGNAFDRVMFGTVTDFVAVHWRHMCEQLEPDLDPARDPRELREKRLIVFLGRVCYMKGCDLLLDAFATVSRQCPDAHLVICGPDSERWQERLIRRAKQAVNIPIIGSLKKAHQQAFALQPAQGAARALFISSRAAA